MPVCGCLQGKLLSDWDFGPVSTKALPPRVVDPAFLAKGKKDDFVTYVENPFQRLPKPEAARKIAALRNQRHALEEQRQER